MSAAALASFLSGKKLLLWGMGREGMSSYRFIRRHLPTQELTVADGRIAEMRATEPFASDAKLLLRPAGEALPPLDEYDLVLKAPGIATATLGLGPDTPLGEKITGQADLFLRFAPGRVVGITGTKGKSTTSFFLHHLLREAGFDVRLGGNFGVPLWDFIEELKDASVTVAELSSYQLEYAKHGPDIGVWLNLYEEHLNYHGSFTAYREAKANLARCLKPGGHLVHREDDAGIAVALAAAPLPQGVTLHPFDAETRFPHPIDGNRQITGAHNRLNACAALLAARLLGLDEAAVPRALETFRSLPHRIEYLGVHGGVAWYNDSISTVPEATLAALAALPETSVLIAGGMDRGVSHRGLAAELLRSPLPHLVLLPETGALLAGLIEAHRSGEFPGPRLHPVATLEEAVALARALAPPASAVLLSPAASSYHRYKNFEERGNAFRDLVAAID